MAIGSRLTQPAPAREHGPHQRFGGRMTASPRRNHYGVIYADPPWTFATYSRKGKGRSAEAYYDCELHRVNASSIAPGISGFSSLGIISAAIFFAFSTIRPAQSLTLDPPTGIERELNVPGGHPTACPRSTMIASSVPRMASGAPSRAQRWS